MTKAEVYSTSKSCGTFWIKTHRYWVSSTEANINDLVFSIISPNSPIIYEFKCPTRTNLYREYKLCLWMPSGRKFKVTENIEVYLNSWLLVHEVSSFVYFIYVRSSISPCLIQQRPVTNKRRSV